MAAATASHKTAIRRKEPSQIAKNLLAHGVLKELSIKSILDFGCAYGADLDFYNASGFTADGCDIEPRFRRTELQNRLYDLVTAVYVARRKPTRNQRRYFYCNRA